MAVWQKAQGVSQDALQKQIQKSQEDRKEIEFFNVVSERHVQTHSGTFQHYYSEEDYRRWYGAFLDACEYFLFLCEGNLIKSPDLRQYIDRFRPRAKEASYYLLTHSHPHYSKRVKVWLG